jgi:hypothetical protein
MNKPQSEQLRAGRAAGHKAAEMLLFLVASAVGVYSLGQALAGLFEVGKGVNLLWLIVTGVAFMILIAQMGRVHDTWPRRESKEKHLRSHTESR